VLRQCERGAIYAASHIRDPTSRLRLRELTLFTTEIRKKKKYISQPVRATLFEKLCETPLGPHDRIPHTTKQSRRQRKNSRRDDT